MPTRPQSLHRYIYTENNPVNRTDPSGHLSGAPPCNLLPNRLDTCTWEDVQRWWEADDSERARDAGAAAARTPYDGIVGFWDFVGQLGSDPRGAINVALYGMLNSPYQIGGDLLAGTVCGNGPRLGRGVAGYVGIYATAKSLFEFGVDVSWQSKPLYRGKVPPPQLMEEVARYGDRILEGPRRQRPSAATVVYDERTGRYY